MATIIDTTALTALCTTAGITSFATLSLPVDLSATGLDHLLADGVGDMGWLARHRDLRLHPDRILPGSIAALVALWPHLGPVPDRPYRRAAYAFGPDYHGRLRRRLAQLGRSLERAGGTTDTTPAMTRACVDSAPLNERSLARLAGLGWIGRQGLLLHPHHGSRCHLGILVSTIPLPITTAGPHPDRCGACQRCVTACPTAAIVEDRVLSERCISYLTIEHRGVIPRELARLFAGRWFGCDACQDCCPWNRRDPITDPELDLVTIGLNAFDATFAGQAIRRLGFERFRRNLLVAAWSMGRDEDIRRIRDEELPLVTAQARELGLE